MSSSPTPPQPPSTGSADSASSTLPQPSSAMPASLVSDTFAVPTPPNTFSCSECNKTFATAQSRNGHIAIHKRKKNPMRMSVSASAVPMNRSGSEEVEPANLTAPSQFPCSQCEKSFKTAKGRAIHLNRSHKK